MTKRWAVEHDSHTNQILAGPTRGVWKELGEDDVTVQVLAAVANWAKSTFDGDANLILTDGRQLIIKVLS